MGKIPERHQCLFRRTLERGEGMKPTEQLKAEHEGIKLMLDILGKAYVKPDGINQGKLETRDRGKLGTATSFYLLS